MKPECPYCAATDDLRILCRGRGAIEPDFICEACFRGTDTGPSFDDLPSLDDYRGAAEGLVP